MCSPLDGELDSTPTSCNFAWAGRRRGGEIKEKGDKNTRFEDQSTTLPHVSGKSANNSDCRRRPLSTVRSRLE